ncbi:hemerythrin domain-containing protein [Gracilimonas mengyeensis]|uniref:Iron-sulfur cluster repair di-iron protein n=1 Tax=Gracilimonas mengyeensis TaxID=1302730 RepID=A0A521D1L4_9BACT|nr:hemerythrin domain-containing protein [Gracilimonas mengyeensis]SMO65552.1 iron-sulfur cluster repair di-iron protein [Gracilimonas mengyeensis]
MNVEEKEPPGILKKTIADFLQEEKRGFRLLQVLGIPTRGNEHKTLMEVCTVENRNEEEILKEIKQLKKGTEFDYPDGIFSWSTELVIRYLKEEHHDYTISLIQNADDYGARAWDVHGAQYPKINQVNWYVQKLKKKLEMHLSFENQKYFPNVLRFFQMNGEPKDGMVQSLKKQTEIVEKDQQDIEYFTQRIRDLTNNFTPPKEACTTFRLFYLTLQKLDQDLKKHHFLEHQYVLSKLKMKLDNLLI